MNLLQVLFPDLALIAIGQALLRIGHGERSFWEGLEKLVYFVLFPALLFVTILRTRFTLAEALPALAAALGSVAVGIALGHLARPALHPSPSRFASGVQCAFRFNSFVLLALSQRLGGEAGLSLAALVMGASIPVVNVAAVLPLARQSRSGLLGELLRNPLILATLAGLAGQWVALRLPAPLEATLTRLGGASIVLGLLAAGAGLRFEGLRGGAGGRNGAIALGTWFTAVKVIAMPAAALALSYLLDLDAAARAIVVLYAAMPTAPSAYILASRMGGDAAFTAFLMTVSMLAALAALPFWLSRVAFG